MAHEQTPPGTATPAQVAMNKATEAAAANLRTASGAAKEMTRTAAGAATEIGTTAKQAATDIGRSAMETGASGMAEFSRVFADMKLPAMPDMETFLAAQRRNMEALSAANRVALEGAQTVARRHMEIVQQTMSEMTENMRQMGSSETPQARSARQADMLKQGYERAVNHMRELADLIQRANGEALGVLNQRFTESMDEVKRLAEKSGQTPPR